jgi:Flp pilus assembly protein TadB
MDATTEELQALLLRFRKQHPDAPADARPTPEETGRLLNEIRERQAAIEAESLRILAQGTRNQPSRSGENSKYMQLLMLLLAAGLVALGIYWLISKL